MNLFSILSDQIFETHNRETVYPWINPALMTTETKPQIHCNLTATEQQPHPVAAE
jgi:hypothetical protein